MSNQIPLERWPSYTRSRPFGKIKLGYMVNPYDPLELVPDPEVVVYLEQAFDYLDKGSSLRETSEWLQQKLLKSFVHQTVSNCYKLHRKPFVLGKTKKIRPPKISRAGKKVI